MIESLNQRYERLIKEAEIAYGEAVAKLNADFQEKLKPYNEIYEFFVQQASEHRDQMVQDAMNKFDRDTAQLRQELETGIAEASRIWAKSVGEAEQAWHEGMEIVKES